VTKNLLARRRDGANPWAVVTTDAEGKVRKSYHDAYGRTTNIIEVVGGSNFSTVFKHTIIGDLTNTTDNVCGNMTNRFGATLTYDEENRLKQYVHGSGTNVFYGYDEGGQRL